MDEEFQARLAAELAERHEPPLGDLVVVALRQGKRLRLVRRAKIAAGAVVATSVLVVGLLLGGQALVAGAGHQRVSAATGTATARLTVVPSSGPSTADEPWLEGDPAPVIDQPAGPKALATPATLAYRFAELLPAGQPSDITRLADSELGVALAFDRGQGPAMVSLTVVPDSWVLACKAGDAPWATCHLGPHGAHVSVIQNPDNCTNATSVVVDHGNGLTVHITLATCLSWNGASSSTTREALSVDEAISIAADPSWGVRMDSTLVAVGNELHPALSAW